jgi:hypothetical protein
MPRNRHSTRVRGLAALTLLVLIAVVGPIGPASPAPRSPPDRSFLVGVDDDWLKWGRSRSMTAVADALGLGAVRITVPWRAGESHMSPAERGQLDDTILQATRVRVVIALYGRADEAPLDDSARDAYCSYATDLARRYRTVRDFVIWNEPNNPTFWQPQFDAGGTSAAPAAYEALLADCWTALHAVRPDVNVIAASAPRGNDSPDAGRNASHSPGVWYERLGEAYRSRGRDEPIFDTVGHNPYPDFSSERPWVQHRASSTIAQGDHGKLTKALRDAFAGTGQALPGEGRVSIWYMEQGFQTTIDRGKEHLYAGWETDRFALPSWSARAGSKAGLAPDQATQLADAITVAYCQPNVGAYFNFLLVDEPDLGGWQSGVLWADWTPKPSYSTFRQVVREVNEGDVDCSALGKVRELPAPESADLLEVFDVRVTRRSPLAATISWRTSLPTESKLAYGLRDSDPTLWHIASGARREHQVELSGLSLGTSYEVWLSAIGPEGQLADEKLGFTVPALSKPVHASVARKVGALLVDGEPVFPLMVWSQCPSDYRKSLAAGINLFAENPCGTLQEQLTALGGRGLSAGVATRQGGSGPGLIGFFHPDEADGVGLVAEDLPDPPAGTEHGVSFLTLTNHFYSRADPLAWGRGMYPGLIAAADVVGFDLYPLQEWCREWTLPEVYDAQRELVRMAHGKPTFQWIEAAEWRCPGGATAVTPATVRAESWLAILGGARGLGFFPATWKPDIADAIRDISRDIAKLGPALYAFPTESAVTPAQGRIRVSARSHQGALYVVAVNASRETREATIRVADLNGRAVTVLDEERVLSADGDSFSDSFGPLAVHIYVAPPAGA